MYYKAELTLVKFKFANIFKQIELADLQNFEKDKKNTVRTMFNGIAHSYDFLNHFLSFGIDVSWRKRLIKEARKVPNKSILDMATGTADLSIMAAKKLSPEKIVGADISTGMLDIGRKKVTEKGLNTVIDLQVQDAENLTFNDNSFDLAMVAFGVRNFENLEKGLSEMKRVIKPKSSLLVLEFSTPENRFVQWSYEFYSSVILPTIGRMVSRNKTAYTYLPKSIEKFPSGQKFVEILEKVGFSECRAIPLTFGIATLYIGVK